MGHEISSSAKESRFPIHGFVRLVLVALVLAAPACAGRRRPLFVPAAQEGAARAIASWRESVARADSRGPARLLYEARVSRGPLRMSGTLAVREGKRTVDATLAGPFGDPVARYDEGALRGKGIGPIAIEEDELRWLLAGAWKGSMPPEVAGVLGQDALLRWSDRQRVEGVIDVPRARFRSLRIERAEGAIAATYSGETSDWPRRIELEDLKTGNKLRLTLIAAEPATE